MIPILYADSKSACKSKQMHRSDLTKEREADTPCLDPYSFLEQSVHYANARAHPPTQTRKQHKTVILTQDKNIFARW